MRDKPCHQFVFQKRQYPKGDEMNIGKHGLVLLLHKSERDRRKVWHHGNLHTLKACIHIIEEKKEQYNCRQTYIHYYRVHEFLFYCTIPQSKCTIFGLKKKLVDTKYLITSREERNEREDTTISIMRNALCFYFTLQIFLQSFMISIERRLNIFNILKTHKI